MHVSLWFEVIFGIFTVYLSFNLLSLSVSLFTYSYSIRCFHFVSFFFFNVLTYRLIINCVVLFSRLLKHVQLVNNELKSAHVLKAQVQDEAEHKMLEYTTKAAEQAQVLKSQLGELQQRLAEKEIENQELKVY